VSNITGVTDASNAPAGSVGEFLSSAGGNVGVTTGAWTTILTYSLPAGDWDVNGWALFSFSGGTGNSTIVTGIHTAANTQPAGGFQQLTVAYSVNHSLLCTPKRYNFSVATNVYVNVFLSSTGTLTAAGTLQARRAR
jgi:hypothetical protein